MTTTSIRHLNRLDQIRRCHSTDQMKLSMIISSYGVKRSSNLRCLPDSFLSFQAALKNTRPLSSCVSSRSYNQPPAICDLVDSSHHQSQSHSESLRNSQSQNRSSITPHPNSWSVQKLVKVLNGPVTPSQPIIEALVRKRALLSSPELSRVIRVSSKCCHYSSLGLLVEEFSRRVAQSAPVSQIASVLLSFTQRRPLSSKQKELARQLVEQAAPKLDDSIKILDCATLASTVEFLDDITAQETMLLKIEKLSASQMSNQLPLRTISLLLSGYMSYSEKACSNTNRFDLFRPSFIAILLGSANRSLQSPGVLISAVDIARLLSSINQGIRISWMMMKPILPARLIPLALRRCGNLDPQGDELCALFNAMVGCWMATRGLRSAVEPKSVIQNLTVLNSIDSEVRLIPDADLRAIGAGLDSAIRSLSQRGLSSVSSTLSHEHCSSMIATLHLAQRINVTRESATMSELFMNKSEELTQHDASLNSGVCLSHTEESWIESILCHRWMRAILEPTFHVSDTKKVTIEAWNGLNLISRTRCPLRAHHVLSAQLTQQLLVLFPPCSSISSEAATQRLRSSVILLEYLLLLRLRPSPDLMLCLLPFVSIDSEEDEGLPLTVSASANDIARLAYVLAEFRLPNEADRLAIFPLLSEVKMEQERDALQALHSAGLFWETNSPKTLAPEFLSNAMACLSKKKQHSLTRVELESLALGVQQATRKLGTTEEISDIIPPTFSSTSPKPSATDVLKFDHQLRSGHPTKLPTHSLDIVTSLFGPRGKRMTGQITSDSPAERSVDAPIPWFHRLRHRLEEYENIGVRTDCQIDGVVVPLMIQTVRKIEEMSNLDSLMKRDPILWEILGDEDPIGTVDMGHPNMGHANMGHENMGHGNMGDANMGHENKGDDSVDCTIKSTSILLFPQSKTSMCFTELSLIGSEIRLGRSIDIDPASEQMRREVLRRSGWNVVMMEDTKFVEAEKDNRLSTLLEGMIPLVRTTKSLRSQ